MHFQLVEISFCLKLWSKWAGADWKGFELRKRHKKYPHHLQGANLLFHNVIASCEIKCKQKTIFIPDNKANQSCNRIRPPANPATLPPNPVAPCYNIILLPASLPACHPASLPACQPLVLSDTCCWGAQFNYGSKTIPLQLRRDCFLRLHNRILFHYKVVKRKTKRNWKSLRVFWSL